MGFHDKHKKNSIGKLLRDNYELKDIYEGQRCFILGNGPSLSDIDLSLIENEITFTMNDFYKIKDIHKIHANYHILCDSSAYQDPEEALNKLYDRSNPLGVFIEDRIYGKMKNNTSETSPPMYLYRKAPEIENLSSVDMDLCGVLPRFFTEIQSAIVIAAYMGFQEIYLLGCDSNEILNKIDSRAMTETNGEHMFFEYYHIFKCYRMLREALSAKGVKLIDLTAGSIINSLEKSTLKEVLGTSKRYPAVLSKNWTLIIKPKSGRINLNLREIWQYRDLICMFVKRNYTAIYKQTILGPVWYIINPLITVFIFTIVFGNIAKLPTDGMPQLLFYMAGNTLWTYFAYCLNTTSTTFINNAYLFGKVYFPRLTMPLSTVIYGFISFMIQLIMFVGFIIYYIMNGSAVRPNIAILMVPFLVLISAFLGLGLGIIISSLTTKYRDLTVLVSFGIQLWMYATPIVYPASELTGRLKTLIMLNPMSSVIEAFRYAFLGSGGLRPWYLLYSTVFTVIVLVLGITIFNRVEKTFIDTV